MTRLTEEEKQDPLRKILFYDSLTDSSQAYSLMRGLALNLNDRILAAQREKLEILIPGLSENCPAVKALREEGIDFRFIDVSDDDFAYGRLMTDLWDKKEGFIILEHDVVPWPGALTELMFCDHPYCAYRYSYTPHNQISALGCMKFSQWVVNKFPDLPQNKNWSETRWSELDYEIVHPLRELVGFNIHHHEPPLAHVK